MSDCLTLDLRRITSKGIVSGSSFAPPPLAQLSHRFGAAPPGDSGADAQAAAQAEALDGLAAARCGPGCEELGLGFERGHTAGARPPRARCSQ